MKKYNSRQLKIYRSRQKMKILFWFTLFMIAVFISWNCPNLSCIDVEKYISPLDANAHEEQAVVGSNEPSVSATVTPKVTDPSPTPKGDTSERERGKPTATPTPSELEEIVAYIARKFEPEGKSVVVRAINCFYSESGLRKDAVGQNTDKHRSKDYGVAQLNDYWQDLTPEMKTDIYANIDKAYEIYKGRAKNGGNGFSAWYGKLCN